MNRVTDSELMSMIAWFEGDEKPSPDKITRGHMALALRELQDRRDADDRRLGLKEPHPGCNACGSKERETYNPRFVKHKDWCPCLARNN